jgi:hypothetical protein
VDQNRAERADFGCYVDWHVHQRYATKGLVRRERNATDYWNLSPVQLRLSVATVVVISCPSQSIRIVCELLHKHGFEADS